MEYYEHNPGDHEDPIAGPTWLMAMVGVILLVVIIFGLTAMYYNAAAEQLDVQLIQREPYELRQYRQQQQALLRGEPAVIEHEDVDGQVTQRHVIDIERAMQLVVSESQQ